MSNFYYGASHHNAGINPHIPTSHNHHGGRSRRAPRLSSAQHNNKQQYRATRTAKEVAETAAATSYRQNFEAARCFDIEDDELFCPFHLLTEDDLQSIHSSGSDRSSLSSGSPESSPLQHQIQPNPTFVLSHATPAYTPPSTAQYGSNVKLHQPMAQRTRNAIPIVDPSTRNNVSPPPSVSPARQLQQQFAPRRW